jgi:membrane protease YdiL (CAAX protease family)
MSDPVKDVAPVAAGGRSWAALVGLVVTLFLVDSSLPTRLVPGDALRDRLIHEVFWWGYAAIIIAWLILVERKGLSTIGFRRPTWKTWLFGVLGGVAAVAALIAQFAIIIPMIHLTSDPATVVRAQIMQTPYWYRVLMVLRAAVVEEVLFRAYIMEKVRQLTGSWVVAIAVSAVAFTYAHLSGWGAVHLIPVGVASLIFALMYVWRRDTPSNIVAHFITDGVGFLLG